jgi:hypothetical protein
MPCGEVDVLLNSAYMHLDREGPFGLDPIWVVYIARVQFRELNAQHILTE